MLEWFKNFYWNLPEWSRLAFIIWMTLLSFKMYLTKLYTKKDFVSASFYIMIFIVLMFSIFNHLGSGFNLISGGK